MVHITELFWGSAGRHFVEVQSASDINEPPIFSTNLVKTASRNVLE